MTSSGLVEPSWGWVPEYHKTYGPEVAELATLAGFAPDPEQSLLLDAAFAVDRQGRAVALEVAELVGVRLLLVHAATPEAPPAASSRPEPRSSATIATPPTAWPEARRRSALAHTAAARGL